MIEKDKTIWFYVRSCICVFVRLFVMMAMLSCPLCCQSCFSSVDLLRTSLISIMNRPLICPICSNVQRSVNDLATHLTQHIEMPSNIGHSEYDDANLVIHNININNNRTNECESELNQFDGIEQGECDGNLTRNLDELPLSPPAASVCEREQSTQIDQIIRPLFVCNLCDCSFRSQELQKMHMQLVHEINIRPPNQGSKLANVHINSPALLQCSLCPKRFKMIGSLRLHVRMVHGVSHAPQKLQYTTERVGNNLVQSTGNNENEIVTSDAIPSTSSSSLHVNSSNLPNVHNNQCDYYSNYGDVFGLADVTSFGIGNGNEDDSSGSEKGDTEHLSNGNNNSKEMIACTEDRVHKCDICNKCFTTKYFLKKHKRLHTGP